MRYILWRLKPQICYTGMGTPGVYKAAEPTPHIVQISRITPFIL